MRTGNPALNERVFQQFEAVESTTMTLNGTVLKTAILLGIVAFTGTLTWEQTMTGHNPIAYLLGGSIVGTILAFVTIFKPAASPYTSPVYAVAEGAALGALSAIFNEKFPGIAFQAVGLTFGTLAALLATYASGLVKATENFKLGVIAATAGIAIFYVVCMVLSLFHIQVPGIFESGWVGIAFSGFVVVIAALNLVLDFDFIEKGVEHGAPKYMEWYGAFGLLVTLVWLYIEILRLLAKLRSRD